MRKKSYSVAVVGCGKIGALFEAEKGREKPASHAGAAAQNPRTKLVALVDTDKKNLNRAKKLFPGTTGYSSLERCLTERRPDIAVIATPPSFRFSMIKKCVENGVRIIICEKPLTLDAKEASRIARFIDAHKITCVLNYQRRFAPLFKKARTDIAEGKLGSLQQVTCYYSNGLYSNGGHALDAALYLLGDDRVVQAVALVNAGNTTHHSGDLNADALLRTKKGVTFALQSFDQEAYGINDIRVFGTKGSVALTDYGRTSIETSARPSQFAGVRQLSRRDAKEKGSKVWSDTRDALAHAIRSYERKTAPTSSARSGEAVIKVLDAVARSARSGGKKILI